MRTIAVLGLLALGACSSSPPAPTTPELAAEALLAPAKPQAVPVAKTWRPWRGVTMVDPDAALPRAKDVKTGQPDTPKPDPVPFEGTPGHLFAIVWTTPASFNSPGVWRCTRDGAHGETVASAIAHATGRPQ